ncbi:hypothetical protein METBIDRAFT_32165 [Metschnikowia bicuspidata var. bicuspidata NRRL YB-4993]|uniref:Retrograde transport protein Dsl1 C-terminal domain-containing protein n=1 Tax=Metschnikowia bicuspidata var. bicuspidata NRRL YB-4993 TaxID=869754 RepID=A0A1A0HCS7_9ASCO|nr:hypothetical protein METBIDRAFT_32165 [Metschnikowia bicuspidata var. bicuspidata NRRL YB-4993]OBA21692.1 hypothetical protein METBIDRAFT_32165 [Metschnikowia bicuspidata var. bicuspidata NRRL YB-4993]
MSFTVELANKESELAHVEEAIADLVSGICVLDLANDPALVLPDAKTPSKNEKDMHPSTIYDLNAKLKDIELASGQLNELWVVKNLLREIEVALDSVSGDDTSCDREDLLSIIANLEKLHGKVSKLSQSNLTIAASMKVEYERYLHDFSATLVHIFHRFIPESPGPIFTVHRKIGDSNTSLGFEEFVDAASKFDTLNPPGEVPEILNSLKSDWARLILEPLISEHCTLQLSHSESETQTLEMSLIDSLSQFSMDSFLHSLQCFVRFINTTNLQSFKNSFSTKISNSLADVISRNIRSFTEHGERLTPELMLTLELLSTSGWNVPLRNIFMAHSDIHETLKDLHLNWITDKYIDELRSVFTDLHFDEDLQNQRIVTQQIEIQTPISVPHEPIPRKNSEPLNALSTDNVSEELEWDDNWGSDDEEELEKATGASVKSDAWDENWDDGWSDDGAEQSETASSLPQSAPEPRTQPKTSSQETNITPNPQSHIETHTFVVSAIPEKLSRLLASFEEETGGADPRILADTIISLALISYPPVSQLFLVLNDLRSVEGQTLYLRECIETEWRLFRQSFSNDVSKVLMKPGLMDCEREDDNLGSESSFDSISQLGTMLEGLTNSQLQYTNSHELKLFVLQVLNLVNNIVLQKILRCDEITEYRSEEFTRYLENLQLMEAGVLAKFGEDIAVLATTNKIMQTKFLINNHLKSIMEYFYQGELYDFSTEELVGVIKSVFIPSDLRQNCLDEIIDVRNS